MTAGVGAIAPEQATYRADIDGLRAVSIALVVAFHAGWERFAGGYVGVDVFFVLSGYLITGLLVREQLSSGRISLTEFYARRIRRLLPLSALVLVVTAVGGLLVLPPLQRTTLIGDVTAAGLYVANWRYAGQATAYSDAEVTDSLLLHYWSLSVEEQFYVLWPLLIVGVVWWLRRRGSTKVHEGLARALLGLVVVSLAASLMLTPQLGPEAYYVTHTRLWEMGAGGLLALWLPRLRPLPRAFASGLAIVGVLAIVGSAVSYDATTSFPGWRAIVPVVGAAAVVVAGKDHRPVVSRALALRPMTALGRWSYAWYLWHWPVIGLALLLARDAAVALPDRAVVIVSVAVSLALAAASHRLVENPLRFAPSLKANRVRNFALGGLLTVVPLGLVGAYAFAGDLGDEATPAPEAPGDRHASPGSAMTPREASRDVGTLGSSECHLSQEATEPRMDCMFGDVTADTTVVLTGDSHAEHWLPALDEVGKREGWRILAVTKSACTPIDVSMWNSNFEREYHECATWRERVREEVGQLGPVDAVVLSRSKGYLNLVLGREERVPSDEVTDAWREGAKTTFRTWSDVADRIIVFRDTPWAAEDVPTCLSAASGRENRCAIPDPEPGGDDTPLHEGEVAAANERVRFVDPRSLVCPEWPCEMVTETGTILYRDRHHLTDTYSRELAGPIQALLRSALAGAK